MAVTIKEIKMNGNIVLFHFLAIFFYYVYINIALPSSAKQTCRSAIQIDGRQGVGLYYIFWSYYT